MSIIPSEADFFFGTKEFSVNIKGEYLYDFFKRSDIMSAKMFWDLFPVPPLSPFAEGDSEVLLVSRYVKEETVLARNNYSSVVEKRGKQTTENVKLLPVEEIFEQLFFLGGVLIEPRVLGPLLARMIVAADSGGGILKKDKDIRTVFCSGTPQGIWFATVDVMRGQWRLGISVPGQIAYALRHGDIQVIAAKPVNPHSAKN